MRGSTEAGDDRRPDRPYLTVLAITWRRTKYLREAIDSALHQTLDRSQYEIVLSKGVPEPDLEEFCRAHGVRVLFESSWDVGRRVSVALDHCRGEVIVPLEDDDEFQPNKLEVVAEEFRRHPDLAYMHHSFELIGEDGAPLMGTGFRTNVLRNIAATGSVFSATGEPMQRLAAQARFDPSWNTSSIAFRRRLMDGRREVLGRLAFLVDRWVYLCALVDRAAILLDERKLTRYRLHAANTSGVGGRGRPSRAAVRELVDRVRGISDRQIADFEVLRSALIADGQPELAASIEARLPLLRFLSALRDPTATRRNILGRFFDLLRGGTAAASTSPWAGRWASTLALYALTPLFVLSPRLGAASYVYVRELPRR